MIVAIQLFVNPLMNIKVMWPVHHLYSCTKEKVVIRIQSLLCSRSTQALFTYFLHQPGIREAASKIDLVVRRALIVAVPLAIWHHWHYFSDAMISVDRLHLSVLPWRYSGTSTGTTALRVWGHDFNIFIFFILSDFKPFTVCACYSWCQM